MKLVNTVKEAFAIHAVTVGTVLRKDFWVTTYGIAKQEEILKEVRDGNWKKLADDVFAEEDYSRVVVIRNGIIVMAASFQVLLGMVLSDSSDRMRTRALLQENEISKKPECKEPRLMEYLYSMLIDKTRMAIVSSASLSNAALAQWKNLGRRFTLKVIDDELSFNVKRGIHRVTEMTRLTLEDAIEEDADSESSNKKALRLVLNL